ncbi:PHD finger-like domain-containing protein 5B, partial [Cucurbita argyrosperma subsp. argyrosperma]
KKKKKKKSKALTLSSVLPALSSSVSEAQCCRRCSSLPPSSLAADFSTALLPTVAVAKSMAKHHPDLIMCRKQPGIAIGRLCEKCDGKCVICDSYVRPCTLVRVCDECNYGSFQGRCVICGGVGISDAYYCKECTQQEKDRDGCPKIVNLGSAKTDLFYERKKYGFKKR